MADIKADEARESSPAPEKVEHCLFMPETKHVMAGWACGDCRVYNGVWRKTCKQCLHPCCVDIPQDAIDWQQSIRNQLGYVDD
jgi:hypothetical protein